MKGYQVQKRELIKGLSLALDLAEKTYFSHSQHIAYTSLAIGNKLKLNASTMELLYYSALLHDIGAGEQYNLYSHCKHGSQMIKNLPVEHQMQEIILYHHEFMDGSGPFGRKGGEIPLLSEIIHIANLFDNQFSVFSSKSDKLLLWLKELDKKFSCHVIDALRTVILDENFIKRYTTQPFFNVLKKAYTPKIIWYSMHEINQFSKVFSDMIDRRSKFTYRHSLGLTSIVDHMTKIMSYDDLTRDKMHIAAQLHDLGKLGVDKQIIDKVGKLDTEERKAVEKHASYTYDILSQIDGFDDITRWASQHHEKLNGRGYPFGLSSEKLSEQSKLMTVSDIYQALREDRPYRKGMSNEKAFTILNEMVDDGALDADIYESFRVEFL